MAEWRQFRKIEHGEHFVVGCDPAAGGGDYCAAQFVSTLRLDVPLVYHSRTIATEMTNELAYVLTRLYDHCGVTPTVAYERANGGVFEMDRLGTLNHAGNYNLFRMPSVGTINPSEPVRYGWDTNTATRPAMLSQLKDAIDNQALRVYDQPTIEEMFSFVVVRTTSTWKAQAESGAHDDLVMALAIAWQLYQIVPKPDDYIELPEHRPMIASTGY